MKYLAMIFNNPDAFESLSEKDRDAMMGEADAFISEFQGTGEFLGGSALAHPATGKTVRVRDGKTTATDGPFAEAKEYLAGYYVIDTDSIERAVEIVSKDPAARFWAVELRPIMDEAGSEM
jgi:hypothetical protein